MSLSIAGMSWVTPLGSSVDEVWQQLVAGETAPVEILENEKMARAISFGVFQPP